MTTLIAGNSGATFSNRVARARPPLLADCAGYHLLGGSEALSLANLVNPAKPLIKIGTPTYPAANYALCSYANGFQTTDSFGSHALTAMMVCTDTRNAADTGNVANSLMFMSMNGGAIMQYWPAGADQQFITGSGTGISAALGNNNIAAVNPDNEPGAVTLINRFRLKAICDTGSEARLTIQEGSALKQFTGTTGTVATTPVKFAGAGYAADAVCRVAAIAYYNRALSFAEVSEVWDFIMDDLEARGIAR